LNEPNFNKLTPVHFLMIVTAIFFSLLNLFSRFKWNIPTNYFWKFIHLGCKLSLFAWIFYSGIVCGRRLTFNLITNLKVTLKKTETDLEISKQENLSYQDQLRDQKNNYDQQLMNSLKTESDLLKRLKKYEQTADEANHSALKNFL
jgi:hypothetical protein